MSRARSLTDASGEVPPIADAALRALQPALEVIGQTIGNRYG